MATVTLLDAAGRRRSPATLPGYNSGRRPATKGRHRPPEPLPVEDIQAVIAACDPDRNGWMPELVALRIKCLIILLWRSGLRISEALALTEHDLDEHALEVLVRRGKGGKQRRVRMDPWAWGAIRPWIDARQEFPAGELFCVIRGKTAGRAMHDSDVRRQFRELQVASGIRRHFHPHQLRHSHAVDLWREGMDIMTICAQLGHAHPGVTSIYLRGITTEELLRPIAARSAPLVPLRL